MGYYPFGFTRQRGYRVRGYGIFEQRLDHDGSGFTLNRRLQTIAAQNGAEYVDLTKALESSPNKLNPKYTNDGLHLNGPGYRAWTRAIQHLVKQ